MFDNEVLRLHRQGLATGAIAIRLGVESSYVRAVVAQAHAKPNDKLAKLEAKVAKAQRALQEAEAELADRNRP